MAAGNDELIIGVVDGIAIFLDRFCDNPRYFEDAIGIDDPVHLNRNYDNDRFDHYNYEGEFVRTSFDDMAEDTRDDFEDNYDDIESDDLL